MNGYGDAIQEQRKLLIIGSGMHGKVIEEIAKVCGYTHVAYLDDRDKCALGKIKEAEIFLGDYETAFVSIGNNQIRADIVKMLSEMGYEIPTLIHPTAYVSPSATIGNGSVIEPHACINANVVVGNGVIVSIGAIVDHNACIGEYCHVDAGMTVKAGESVPKYTKYCKEI